MQTLNRFEFAESDSDSMANNLGGWYRAQPTVRRLLAVEDSAALTILVTLEPTADGGDSFPTFLAMQGEWTTQLGELAQCPVQLKLIAPEVLEDADLTSGSHVVADICWRDPCAALWS